MTQNVNTSNKGKYNPSCNTPKSSGSIPHPSSRRVLSVFTLAMINVSACIAIKNLPIMAGFGMQSIFYYGIASIVFFIPCSLVSAELATGWPEIGGLYNWVKEALGPRIGFFAVWLQWVQNLAWFPTQLTFVGGVCAYLIDPALVKNKTYMLIMVFTLYWGSFAFNMLGMRVSGLISTVGAILGTLVPGGLLIFFATMWVLNGKPIDFDLSWSAAIPKISTWSEIAFLAGMFLSISGMEMSAAHAREVENPQRDFPRAILLSAVLILGLYVLGTLAISVLVTSENHSLVDSVLKAFANALGTESIWISKIVLCLILLGSFGSLTTWMIGPAKGLLASTRCGELPPILQKLNKHETPVAILVLQGIIVCALSFFYVFMPSVESAFWILTVMCSQFYLIVYILMFLSAIILRFTRPHVIRSYKVPGGNIGMILVAGTGLLACIFPLIIGYFMPPGEAFQMENPHSYPIILGSGVALFCLVPFVIDKFRKPEWAHPIYADND